MLRSMYAAVSGLRGHQTMMDVIGNNIANVNTSGYKASSAVFQDLLSQLLAGASNPTNGGGTNPTQIGLGMRLAGTVTSFTQGGLQTTGRATDMSIQGDGFFAVRKDGETLFTRAGSFSFDADGRLVTASGAIVQGWTAANGTVDRNGEVGDLVMPLGQLVPPTATTAIVLGGNLPSDATTPITTSRTVYDDQGTAFTVSLTLTKTAADQWSMQAQMPDATGTLVDVGSAMTLDFDPATGALTGSPTLSITPTVGQWANPISFTVDDPNNPLRQFAGSNTFGALSQNGSGAGYLQTFQIGPDGTITGVFSNGVSQALGQIALANFNNPGGLENAGGSLWRATTNSGAVQVGVAAEGGRGALTNGTLEMSNVDLAQEFTNLIVAQRGFQANSRVITAADEILSDVVNLKR